MCRDFWLFFYDHLWFKWLRNASAQNFSTRFYCFIFLSKRETEKVRMQRTIDCVCAWERESEDEWMTNLVCMAKMTFSKMVREPLTLFLFIVYNLL